MSFTREDPASLARELGLVSSADELPAWAGLARIIRIASGRWGACRRVELKRHALELCGASGFPEEAAEVRVEQVLDLLVKLRDLEEASVAAALPDEGDDGEAGLEEEGADTAPAARPAAAGRYLVPALPRLVTCGETAFLSGPLDELLQGLGRPFVEDGPASVVRWVASGEVPVDLRAEHGIGLWTLADWLGAPEHQRCQRRISQRLDPELVAPAAGELPELWRLLDLALDRDGAGISDDRDIRVLTGRPGDHFGRPDGSGRWREPAQTPDGRWCAVRPGYSAQHRHPGLAEIKEGSVKRWIDLYDWDELLWAHLSRAARVGPRETYRQDGADLHLTTALPRQLRRLDALGVREGWRWRLLEEAAGELSRALGGAGLVKAGAR